VIVDLFASLGVMDAPTHARAAQDAGYDGLWTTENRHDPFLAITRAADATTTLTLGTGVAIAFARTPMTVAYPAYALAELCRGRFILGLGSQVRAHITSRFSMPWSSPAERMDEFVRALRSIFAAWHDGEPLAVRGEHYRHTLMNENFAPPRHEFGPPPIYLAGVGPRMTAVAGELADGFLAHPFTTPGYLADVTLPLLHAAGRAPTRVLSAFAVIATTDDERRNGERAARRRIGFYASTPAYRPVLAHHGLADLQPRADALARAGSWDELTDLVPDQLVELMVAVGDPTDVAAQLHARYGTLVDRIGLNLQTTTPPPLVDATIARLRAAR
jgi:probable F420-dependent oxidoreductase